MKERGRKERRKKGWEGERKEGGWVDGWIHE